MSMLAFRRVRWAKGGGREEEAGKLVVAARRVPDHATIEND
jgi:hypothetical protein